MLNCFYSTFLAFQLKLASPKRFSASIGKGRLKKWMLKVSCLIWPGKRNWKENWQIAEVEMVWLKFAIATTTAKLCNVNPLATKARVNMIWTGSWKSNAGCHAWEYMFMLSGLYWHRMGLHICISKFKPVLKYHLTLFICWGSGFLLFHSIKPNSAQGSSDK